MPSNSSTSSSDRSGANGTDAGAAGPGGRDVGGRDADGWRFLLRGLAFLSPFLAALLLECCVLPLDAFTFRVWEAAKRSRWDSVFPPGPFYPNLAIDRVETGDLASHTAAAVPKRVRWRTDRFGYRRENTAREDWDVVVIGDSFVAGTGLTQADMLTERLAARTGLAVYPLAHDRWPRHLLREARFRDHPPRIVVLAHCERTLGYLRAPDPDPPEPEASAPAWTWPAATRINHMRKRAMLRFARARVRDAVASVGRPLFFGEAYAPVRLRGVRGERGEFLFLFGPEVNRLYPPEAIPGFVERLVRWRDRFAADGIRFLYLPIPNKENIYHERLEAGPPPAFLARLHRAAAAAGLETVDLESRYRAHRASGDERLYHTDDTHWTPLGVRIAADALADAIASDPAPAPHP
ncbi:MAG: alginate O-acetyltransferase AlgX-related protein [Planctomycetota bacterium]